MPFEGPQREGIVSKFRVGDDLNSALKQAVDALGGLENILSPEDKILLKANFNSPDPYPASSDPAFLRASVMLLKEYGSHDITLAGSSGLAWQPTSRVFKKLGVKSLAQEMGVELLNMDEGEWVELPVRGRYLKTVKISKAVFEADRIVYLPNAKTHSLARFSMALKFAVGLTEPLGRRELHAEHLEEKIPEINLAVRPDLILLDARKCFVTKGPAKGKRKWAGFVLASRDPVALDMEGLKILKSFKAKNRLDMPISNLPQMAAAMELDIGARSEEDYRVIRG